ncbi:MAG: hypothetical protein DHS20C21_03110 [Gemmatimonadota bacterium]|nr:MAG: hypothetical protein DHS20C21_03110 [Gemmatimonadota bacterium]
MTEPVNVGELRALADWVEEHHAPSPTRDFDSRLMRRTAEELESLRDQLEWERNYSATLSLWIDAHIKDEGELFGGRTIADLTSDLKELAQYRARSCPPPECDHDFVKLADNERFEANGHSRCSKCGRLKQ